MAANMDLTEGCLITFEGIEGSGKTTQIEILEDYFKLRKRRCLVTREPGGTLIGDHIRKLLLDPDHHQMVPLAELFLYEAARAQHVSQVIRPALESGQIVLCDRFYDATTAYQGGARQLKSQAVKELNELAAQNIVPRLTLLLDCPVEMGLGRAHARYQSKDGLIGADRIEREKMEFHERVRQGYLEIARNEPNRVVILDASGDIDALQQKIMEEIKRVVD